MWRKICPGNRNNKYKDLWEWKEAERGKGTPECQETEGESGPNKDMEVGGSKTKKQISLIARIQRKW